MPTITHGLSTGLTTIDAAANSLHDSRKSASPSDSVPADQRLVPFTGEPAHTGFKNARASFFAAGLHTGILPSEYAETALKKSTEEPSEERTFSEKFFAAFHREIGASTAAASKATPSTDPSTPQGEAWLRSEFEKIRSNVTDQASKPSYDTLERVIAGNFKPIKERSTNEIYWEHILLRYVGNVPLDIERNYSEKLKLALIGSAERLLHGHEGITESARILNELLATTQYTIVDTIMRDTGKEGGWVTERWAYLDEQKKHNQVLDGIDSFLIKEGQIDTKMINYTVEPAGSAFDFYTALGVTHPDHNPNVD